MDNLKRLILILCFICTNTKIYAQSLRYYELINTPFKEKLDSFLYIKKKIDSEDKIIMINTREHNKYFIRIALIKEKNLKLYRNDSKPTGISKYNGVDIFFNKPIKKIFKRTRKYVIYNTEDYIPKNKLPPSSFEPVYWVFEIDGKGILKFIKTEF